MTRIGVGGLINLDKLRQSHIVLNDIHLFHHHATLQRAMEARLQEEDRSRLVQMYTIQNTLTFSYPFRFYISSDRAA